MSLVRRARYVITNYSVGPMDEETGSWPVRCSWSYIRAIQDVPSAICWRCKRANKRGDHLVHIAVNSDDVMKPYEIYHYRCIPSARWRVLAGSLPAWELPTDESPAEKSGTSSAATPTIHWVQ